MSSSASDGSDAKQGGKSKKRPSKYLPHTASKRKKDLELHSGLQGFFITCDGGREHQSSREAISLLEQFYDKLVKDKHSLVDDTLGELKGNRKSEESQSKDGPEKKAPLDHSTKGSKCSDIESLLKEEIAGLRDSSQACFASLETGCSGIVFIRMLKDDEKEVTARGPNQVAEAIMQECLNSQRPLTRFCLRFLPVGVTCYASEDEVRKSAKSFLLEHFPIGASALKFAVVYDARANTSLDRMVIINAVAKLVEQPHFVDLKNPDKTIVVQVVKTVCAIGVVPNYKQYAKYNLRQLAQPKEKAEA